MSKQITIKSGKHRGSWALMNETGFGSNGESAQYRAIGKSGKLLNKAINLSKKQVATIEAA